MERFVPDAASGSDDDAGSDLDAFDYLHSDSPPESVDAQLFTVTNPPRSVAVTAHLDGRVQRVRLFFGVTEYTEAELAEEVVVIADLAKQDARSAQHQTAFDSMRAHGHDIAGTRDFLTRSLDLPSPEAARAARTQVFATRYQGDTDHE